MSVLDLIRNRVGKKRIAVVLTGWFMLFFCMIGFPPGSAVAGSIGDVVTEVANRHLQSIDFNFGTEDVTGLNIKMHLAEGMLGEGKVFLAIVGPTDAEGIKAIMNRVANVAGGTGVKTTAIKGGEVREYIMEYGIGITVVLPDYVVTAEIYKSGNSNAADLKTAKGFAQQLLDGMESNGLLSQPAPNIEKPAQEKPTKKDPSTSEVATVKPLDEPVEVSNTDNIAWVENGPTAPTTFTISTPHLVTYIKNYHWNYGKGAAPGKIGLRDEQGRIYGPWQASGSPGQGGVQNANWEVFPNIVIPAGTYTVTDSEPSTWSQNAESGGRGMGVVKATPHFQVAGEKGSTKSKPGIPGAVGWTESPAGVGSVGNIPGPSNTTEALVGVAVPGLIATGLGALAGLGGGGFVPPGGTPLVPQAGGPAPGAGGGYPGGSTPHASSVQDTTLLGRRRREDTLYISDSETAQAVGGEWEDAVKGSLIAETADEGAIVIEPGPGLIIDEEGAELIMSDTGLIMETAGETVEPSAAQPTDAGVIDTDMLEETSPSDDITSSEIKEAETQTPEDAVSDIESQIGDEDAGQDYEEDLTGIYDEEGFDPEGYDQDGYDKDGYDRNGYDRDGFDEAGFDQDGYDREGFDRQGFDGAGYDREGFNRSGFDKEGYDREGFNKAGYDREGFDRQGFDGAGYDHEGFNKAGYDRDGYGRSGFNAEGYDREGFDVNGFDRKGYNRSGYDAKGFDREGYDRDGFNKDGWDRDGYDRSGLDKNGYDREGYNKAGFDQDGYDRDGFDKNGRQRDGYDEFGFDKNGFNKDGFDKDGYDREGFDYKGYNRDGYDPWGYNRQGYDRDGYHWSGYNADGYDRRGRHWSENPYIRKSHSPFSGEKIFVDGAKIPEWNPTEPPLGQPYPRTVEKYGAKPWITESKPEVEKSVVSQPQDTGIIGSEERDPLVGVQDQMNTLQQPETGSMPAQPEGKQDVPAPPPEPEMPPPIEEPESMVVTTSPYGAQTLIIKDPVTGGWVDAETGNSYDLEKHLRDDPEQFKKVLEFYDKQRELELSGQTDMQKALDEIKRKTNEDIASIQKKIDSRRMEQQTGSTGNPAQPGSGDPSTGRSMEQQPDSAGGDRGNGKEIPVHYDGLNPEQLANLSKKMKQVIEDKTKEGYFVRNTNAAKKIFWNFPIVGKAVERAGGWKGGQCGEYGEWGKEWSKEFIREVVGEDAIITSTALERNYFKNHRATKVIMPNGERYVFDYWESMSSKEPKIYTEKEWMDKWKKGLGGNPKVVEMSDDEMVLKTYIDNYGEEKGIDLYRRMDSQKGKDKGKTETIIRSYRRAPW